MAEMGDGDERRPHRRVRARGSGPRAPLTRPRPGHADIVGMQKYGFDEARPVLERASARETAMRVALGTVAAKFLGQLGITLVSHTVAIGGVEDSRDGRAAGERCRRPRWGSRPRLRPRPLHPDGRRDRRGEEGRGHPRRRRRSPRLRPPPGLGSHVHWDRRLDSRLAGALMGVQAIKGVEVGDGFLTAARPGSAAHDEILVAGSGYRRASNRAGGTEGGMSTGEPLRVRAR